MPLTSPSDFRNHLIGITNEFDRPDRRSREPIAHIRQYYRARRGASWKRDCVVRTEIMREGEVLVENQLAGSTRASHLIFALRGRVICAAIKAIAAAIDSHAPGIARLPVSWIKYVTMAGVDPPIVVAKL